MRSGKRSSYSGLLDKFLLPIGATPALPPQPAPWPPFLPRSQSANRGSDITLTDQAARLISLASGPVGSLLPGGGLNRQKVIPDYCFGPPPAPAGLSRSKMVDMLKRHGDIAAQHMPIDLPWFKSKVQNKGVWDYKQRNRDLTKFGNYHFGYVGTRQGIPEAILRSGAGVAQILAGTSQPGFFTSLFDDPSDQEQIARGAMDARNGCY